MRLFLSILLLGVLSFSESSYALTCLKNGQISTEFSSIQSSIAVPNNAPKDLVLWRSSNYAMTVTCNLEHSWDAGEDVYIYLSPTDQSMTQLGPDLEFGINLNGVDMTCSRLPGCRVKIGMVNSCMIFCAKFDFHLSYNFFISKKSTAAQSAGKDGPLSGLSRYDAFQIDGAGGINSSTAKNFRMTITGLDRIRYVGCLARLSVSPETVNFGKISTANVRAGSVINEKSFTVLITKSCNSVYGVSAVMKPVGGSVQNGDTLVPSQNSSVGIRLMRENRSVLPFDQEFELSEPSGDMAISKRFTAQLRWLTNNAILGAFKTGATLDIYYK
ncbi:fimbrial protein [Pseudomonas chlororaphis]|uniref:fimbrial protein n=1 Tax=Pseudomonas chlororaphis TaxID=587753 RepID=UPI0015DE0311|nr:fimbrial protein [Pseudomonas chlororaphis]QLL11377.1 fimbrial protein [Pseudomonas chlororaphis subsp. aurantiaca]